MTTAEDVEPVCLYSVHVYVDKDIEFDIGVSADYTCGMLLDAATKRYQQLKTQGKRRRIVALKSAD